MMVVPPTDAGEGILTVMVADDPILISGGVVSDTVGEIALCTNRDAEEGGHPTLYVAVIFAHPGAVGVMDAVPCVEPVPTVVFDCTRATPALLLAKLTEAFAAGLKDMVTVAVVACPTRVGEGETLTESTCSVGR
jgi:hypothetical protein